MVWSDLPSHWTAERRELRGWLGNHAPALGDLYASAVEILYSSLPHGRIYLVAHAVREIGNALPAFLADVTSGRADYVNRLDAIAREWKRAAERLHWNPLRYGATGSSAHPEELIGVPQELFRQIYDLVEEHDRARSRPEEKATALLDVLAPGTRDLRAALRPALRDWVELIGWFQRAHVPRSSGGPDDAVITSFTERFQRFESALLVIIRGFFPTVREIDDILAEVTPSKEGLERLSPYLRLAPQARYFFGKIDDPAWLEPLREKGYFGQPPPVQAEGQDGATRHVAWPATEYLARMASRPNAQRTVTDIVEQIPDTSNYSVQRDLMEIALRLAPPFAARLVPKALKCLDDTAGFSTLIADRVAELAVRLARDGHRKEALALLDAFVRMRRSAEEDPLGLGWKLDARFRPPALEDLFQRRLRDAVGALGMDGLTVLCDALSRAIELGEGHDRDGWIDSSEVWSREVEHVSSNWDVRSVLTGEVFHAAEALGDQAAEQTTAVIGELERHRWLVFRRIALSVLSRRTELTPNLVRDRLLDRKLFDRLGREYWNLLRQGFSHIDPTAQYQLLQWIDAGPAENQVRKSLAFWLGRPPTDDEVARRIRRWQWRRLGALEGLLDEVWSARLRALVAEFGIASGPDRSRAPEGSFGWPSPIGREEMAAMSVVEIVDYLKPFADSPSAEPEALGQLLADVIEGDSGRFARDALQLKSLAPTYARHALQGFEAALRRGSTFDWAPVLSLCRWVAEQAVDLEEESSPTWGRDPSWGWTKMAAGRLLSTSFSHELPMDSRQDVWRVLELLAKDLNNQRRAHAINAVIDYATWVVSNTSPAQTGTRGFARVPEAREALEAALGVHASVEVHSECGARLNSLVWLDEEWVNARLELLFPSPTVELAEAAWQRYLRASSGPNDAVYSAVRDVYVRGLGWLAPTREVLPGVASDSRLWQERYGEHLVILYGRGTLDKHGDGDLLERFLTKADQEVRRYTIAFVGHSLRDEDIEESASDASIPIEVLHRFVALWERLASSTVSAVKAREQGLPAFGSWFASGRFDDDWTLRQLEVVLNTARLVEAEHNVVQRLAQLADRFPAQVARCFEHLVAGLSEPSRVLGWIDHVKDLLGAAIRSNDAAAQADAIAALNRLGALGFGHRELLPLSDDLRDPAAIPYFTWDAPMTIAEIQRRLREDSAGERNRLLGRIMRQARPRDVWMFTTPQEVDARWADLESYLGRQRAFWESLLGEWKAQGLLAER